mgnify:FL=1
MGLIIKKRASGEEIKRLSAHFKGYIKVVVDIERGVLAGGGDRHADDEKILLEDGSKQKNLWGGGYDLETKEIDYNSIINLRPKEGNPSRDILSEEVRKKFEKIIRKLLS